MSRFSKNESDQRTLLGFTLSKRGWNNVLIYIVLLLMFAFYFLGHENRNISGSESAQPFLNTVVVDIADPNYRFTRVGNQWQQQRGNPIAEQAFTAWLDTWQRITIAPTNTMLQGEEYWVELTFANEPAPVMVGVFFYQNEALLALPGADQVFRVVDASPSQLKPQ